MHVERPTRLGLACLPGLVVGRVLGLPWLFSPALPALTSAGGAGGSIACFVVGAGLVTYMVSDVLFLEHRLYDGGLVTRSRLPLVPIYVIPVETIAPGSVEARPPAALPQGSPTRVVREWRQHARTPLTLQFIALPAKSARALSRGAISWDAACSDLAVLPADVRSRARDAAVLWSLSFRDAPAGVARLRSRLERRDTPG